MNLTDEEIRIKVAEAMGWTNITAFHFEDVVTGKPKILHKGDCPALEIEDQWLPNYPESLDACAEFEKTLTDEEQQEYFYQLNEEVGLVSPRSPAWLLEWSVFKLVTATARQRCLAYLKTKGLIP
jgi:hypothetical protein